MTGLSKPLSEWLAWIQAAPKEAAPIHQLCIRPISGEREFLNEIELCPERGVLGDRWINHSWLYLEDGSSDPRVQISILPYRTWKLFCEPLQSQGKAIHPGDTIIADLDCSEANLPVGQQLQAGSALIEVSDIFNTACQKWRDRYGSQSIQLINQRENRCLRLRGLFCKIVQAGRLNRQSIITKL